MVVVPHGGTWIEITFSACRSHPKKSYLTEVRGLKYVDRHYLQNPDRSYLTEVRGLKSVAAAGAKLVDSRTSRRYVD